MENLDGKLVDDKSEIANILNDNFYSVVVSPTTDQYKCEVTNSYDVQIDPKRDKQLLLNLKNGKAPGPDALTKRDHIQDISFVPLILTVIFQ